MVFVGALTGGGSGEAAYWSFSGGTLSPVIAAFVVVVASGWVSDLGQGRVELILAGPVSWSRLVAGRLEALVMGVAAITGGVAGLLLGAAAVGGSLDLGRLAVACVLLGAALGALAAIVVATLRRLAVTVLAAVLVASYLVPYFVRLLDGPAWLERLSVFAAFGHTYLEWPPLSGLIVLWLPGALLAAFIAGRTPKVGRMS